MHPRRRGLAVLVVLAFALLPAHAAATRTEMVASAAFTASGNSAKFQMSTANQLILGVDVTAFSGTTPTLTVWLQVSDDGGTTWYDMPADFTLISATTAATGTMSATAKRNVVDTLVISVAADYLGVYKHLASDAIRLKWVISGTTPSITFSASVVTK